MSNYRNMLGRTSVLVLVATYFNFIFDFLIGMSAHLSRKLSNCTNMWDKQVNSMLSKTILLGLIIFQCGSERSVHGRPSWELAPYDRESERTKDFIAWCKDTWTECCFNERAGECLVTVRFSSQFFVLDKSKSIPIRIGGQTAWEAVRNDLIKNKEKIASKDYELHGRCAVLFC